MAPIASNFNNFYGSGRVSILPATLYVNIDNIEINKGDYRDLSTIISQITGFVFDETVESVFPDGIPYKFNNSNGKEYEIGDVGESTIKISDPMNYIIEYGISGKLTINEPDIYQYCDNDDDNDNDNDDDDDEDDAT